MMAARRSKKQIPWKVLLGFAATVLPSFLTYMAARVESNEAKIRAEVAYTTMQTVVKELQEASYDQAMHLAKIDGRLESMSRRASLPTGVHMLSAGSGDVSDGDGLAATEAPVQLKAPPDFLLAVQEFKAKK